MEISKGIEKTASFTHKKSSLKTKKGLREKIRKNKLYYFLMLPSLIYFLIFSYMPMFGIVIAFKDIAPFEGLRGIFSGPWVGLTHFKNFVNSYYFWNIMGNTLMISIYKIGFGFPAPIILALLLNEVKNERFKKTIQTISYLPHFISMVVLAGLLNNILSTDGGIVNEIVKLFGKDPIQFLGDARYFRSVLVISDIWGGIGWSSIIYLAAITGVDGSLYEAAVIDGAGKLRQTWSVTLPAISNIVVIMFIFRIGSLLNAGFEQIFNLYSPPVYEVSDIIDTFVYRAGLQDMRYSFAAAVGLFKSVIALILIVSTNLLANKFDQKGLW